MKCPVPHFVYHFFYLRAIATIQTHPSLQASPSPVLTHLQTVPPTGEAWSSSFCQTMCYKLPKGWISVIMSPAVPRADSGMQSKGQAGQKKGQVGLWCLFESGLQIDFLICKMDLIAPPLQYGSQDKKSGCSEGPHLFQPLKCQSKDN